MLTTEPPLSSESRITISVAELGWLSRISAPDIYPSRISDPRSRIQQKQQQQRRRGKIFVALPFYVSFTKLELFFGEKVPYRKKFEQFFKELQYFFAKKLSLSSQKHGLGIHDPRCGIRKKLSRSRIQGSKRQRIRIRNTDRNPQYWTCECFKIAKFLLTVILVVIVELVLVNDEWGKVLIKHYWMRYKVDQGKEPVMKIVRGMS